jgi:hypothetical protein
MAAAFLPTASDVFKILLTVAAAGTLGQWLASRWQLNRQAREEDLIAAARLYDLYGRFFSTWKAWRESGYVTTAQGDATALEILGAATAAEGEMEALMMRVASERCLSRDDIDRFGALRQSYQRLRESIAGDTEYSLARWKCSWHEEYVAMKALATDASAVLADPRTGFLGLYVKRPSATDAKRTLLAITSNDYEARWHRVGLEAAEHGSLLPDWDRERFGNPCSPMEGRQRADRDVPRQ